MEGERDGPWRVGTIWVNGVEVTPTDSFRVTMNNFLASGGEGFTVGAFDPVRAVVSPDGLCEHGWFRARAAPDDGLALTSPWHGRCLEVLAGSPHDRGREQEPRVEGGG